MNSKALAPPTLIDQVTSIFQDTSNKLFLKYVVMQINYNY